MTQTGYRAKVVCYNNTMRFPLVCLGLVTVLTVPGLMGQSAARHPVAKRLAARVAPTGPVIVIDTTLGRLVCRLYATQAPEMTANFVGLAQGKLDWTDAATGELQHGKPMYDGTALVGSVDAAVGDRKLQGADPLAVKKPSGLGFDQPGRLSMTIKNKEISRSQFSIASRANAEFEGRGAVFGQCDTAAQETAAKIAHALLPTDNHPAHGIAINKVTVLAAGDPMPAVAADVAPATVVPQPTPMPVSVIPAPDPTGPTAVIETSMGKMTCRLFKQEAPIAVGVFIGLAEGTKDWTSPGTKKVMKGKRFYDGLLFNRVLPDFMIQNQNYPGGSTGGGDIGIHYGVETVPGLSFDRPGRMAMANAGPDTNDSSFFITEVPRHGLDDKYTIFGQCDDEAVKLVGAIARVPRNEHNRPLVPVVIRKVTIVRGTP